ncbi:MAG: tetratricopeptide repeat protein [Muribaculaceae bacterium]|nr:tetratricopeptide repeat protein [Muribaculaceae bacterium]
MPNLKYLLIAIVVALAGSHATTALADDEMPTVKKERNHIRSGNKLYKQKRYAEAEVEYRKALQESPASPIAQFNLATALLRQGSATASQDSKDNPANEAQGILAELAKNCPNHGIRGKAAYDLGNIAYTQQNWGEAIEHYKNALRCNPDDDQARDNLRLAQLKKQQQDQQNKNQNKDKQDQNKDKQDQNKDKQDQNKDKQNQQNQDQQNQQNQDQQNQDRQNGQPKQENGMSQQNAEQVLKAMQDQERATQQRINARKAEQRRGERARTNRKW